MKQAALEARLAPPLRLGVAMATIVLLSCGPDTRHEPFIRLLGSVQGVLDVAVGISLNNDWCQRTWYTCSILVDEPQVRH